MIKKSMQDSWKIVKRGNMFMLAIGLLLGASFNSVISSLANDVIMAAIAKIWNASSVESLSINGILIGKFIGALISFLIVSLIIFLSLFIFFIIKNLIWKWKTKRHPELLIEKEKEPTTEEKILLELQKINQNLQTKANEQTE
ncbi:MscL family protein [Mycoplasmopsis hyopharyngis]|uniref:large conductance mechanosensitive channel protein MscL n=1 Tax=Mycoplasmopsis hyopharyngis TaxID=29558 RepID=UPI003872CFB9